MIFSEYMNIFFNICVVIQKIKIVETKIFKI